MGKATVTQCYLRCLSTHPSTCLPLPLCTIRRTYLAAYLYLPIYPARLAAAHLAQLHESSRHPPREGWGEGWDESRGEGWGEGWGAGIKARAKGRARLGFRLGVRVRVGVLGCWA